MAKAIEAKEKRTAVRKYHNFIGGEWVKSSSGEWFDNVNPADTTYYLGRQTLLTTGKSRVARWRKVLFAFLAKNSRAPTEFFHLPPNRVVELGLQIEL